MWALIGSCLVKYQKLRNLVWLSNNINSLLMVFANPSLCLRKNSSSEKRPLRYKCHRSVLLYFYRIVYFTGPVNILKGHQILVNKQLDDRRKKENKNIAYIVFARIEEKLFLPKKLSFKSLSISLPIKKSVTQSFNSASQS